MVYVHSQRSHRITEPFEDEIHPRLRFGHRGIVAMANKLQWDEEF